LATAVYCSGYESFNHLRFLPLLAVLPFRIASDASDDE